MLLLEWRKYLVAGMSSINQFDYGDTNCLMQKRKQSLLSQTVAVVLFPNVKFGLYALCLNVPPMLFFTA